MPLIQLRHQLVDRITHRFGEIVRRLSFIPRSRALQTLVQDISRSQDLHNPADWPPCPDYVRV